MNNYGYYRKTLTIPATSCCHLCTKPPEKWHFFWSNLGCVAIGLPDQGYYIFYRVTTYQAPWNSTTFLWFFMALIPMLHTHEIHAYIIVSGTITLKMLVHILPKCSQYIGWSDVTVTCSHITIYMLWGNTAYCTKLTTTTHTIVLWPFYRDHPGEPVPEENF